MRHFAGVRFVDVTEADTVETVADRVAREWE
jgi:hypothetical protein